MPALLIDLHAHTYPKSDDSFLSPDQLVEEARAAGLEGLCLTEHDAFWGWDETAALARRHNFLVLPGCEINTDDGHILVFGLERYIFGMHKFDFLHRAAAAAGGVVIAAHPYRRRFLEGPGREPAARAEMLAKAAADPIFGRCHGVETANGRGRPAQNQFAADLYRRLDSTAAASAASVHPASSDGLAASPPSVHPELVAGRTEGGDAPASDRGGWALRAATGGSDAHYPGQVGATATEFYGRVNDLGDLIELLRRGACRPVYLRPPEAATPAASTGPGHAAHTVQAAPAPAD